VSSVSVGGYLVWGAVGGGGDQPEAHLPASTVSLAKVDLDPAVAQKVDAVRFARRFPGGKDLREDGDPREWLWERLTQGSPNLPAWSRAREWLGDRAAVAVLPDATDARKPQVVAVVEVTDGAAAGADLSGVEGLGVAVGDGWVYLARTSDVARAALGAAQVAPLSGTSTFRQDFDRLGEDGVAAFWYDGAGLSALLPAVTAAGSGIGGDLAPRLSTVGRDVRGHGAFALRFSGPDLEFTGTAVGVDATEQVSGAGTGVETLPAGTLAATGFAGLGPAVSKSWDTTLARISAGTGEDAGAFLASGAAQLGLRLPDDLVTLFGTWFAVALAAPDDGLPAVGVRVESRGPRVRPLVEKLAGAAQENGLPLSTQVFDGGYSASVSPAQASALATPGDLGSSPAFVEAVPDAGDAAFVAYGDVQALLATYGTSMSEQDRAVVAPLEAVGVSVAVAENGDATLRVKVTTR